MPDYGDVNYWNERYGSDYDNPFDWLFSFEDLSTILGELIPNRNEDILLIGSGNAPFSPDMHKIGGYTNLLNTDLSDVVISQQAAKYPEQRWEVMDILDMKMPDLSVKCLVDKSLIDTLLCYEDSKTKTAKMIDEIYRILAPGSRYITFSLHSIEDIRQHFEKPHFEWKTSFFRVQSSRWADTPEAYERAVAHTMIVCDKPCFKGVDSNGKAIVEYYNHSTYPLIVEGTLGEVEYWSLKAKADKVCLRRELEQLQFNDILECLDHALLEYDNDLLDTIRINTKKNDILAAVGGAKLQPQQQQQADITPLDRTEDDDNDEADEQQEVVPDIASDIAVADCIDPADMILADIEVDGDGISIASSTPYGTPTTTFNKFKLVDKLTKAEGARQVGGKTVSVVSDDEYKQAERKRVASSAVKM